MESFRITNFNKDRKYLGDQIVSFKEDEMDLIDITVQGEKNISMTVDVNKKVLLLDNANGRFNAISSEETIAIYFNNVVINSKDDITITVNGSDTYKITGNSIDKLIDKKFENMVVFDSVLDIALPSNFFDLSKNGKLKVENYPMQMFDALSEKPNILKYESENGKLKLMKINNDLWVARGQQLIPVYDAEYFKNGDKSFLGLAITSGTSVRNGKAVEGLGFPMDEKLLKEVATFIRGKAPTAKDYRNESDIEAQTLGYHAIQTPKPKEKISADFAASPEGEPNPIIDPPSAPPIDNDGGDNGGDPDPENPENEEEEEESVIEPTQPAQNDKKEDKKEDKKDSKASDAKRPFLDVPMALLFLLSLVAFASFMLGGGILFAFVGGVLLSAAATAGVIKTGPMSEAEKQRRERRAAKKLRRQEEKDAEKFARKMERLNRRDRAQQRVVDNTNIVEPPPVIEPVEISLNTKEGVQQKLAEVGTKLNDAQNRFDELSNSREALITGLTNRRDEAETAIRSGLITDEAQLNSMQNIVQVANETIQAIEQAYTSIGTTYNNAADVYNETQNLVESYDNALSTYQQRLATIESEIGDLTRQNADLEPDTELSVQLQTRINEQQAEYTNVREDLERFENGTFFRGQFDLIEDLCTRCNEKFDELLSTCETAETRFNESAEQQNENDENINELFE